MVGCQSVAHSLTPIFVEVDKLHDCSLYSGFLQLELELFHQQHGVSSMVTIVCGDECIAVTV